MTSDNSVAHNYNRLLQPDDVIQIKSPSLGVGYCHLTIKSTDPDMGICPHREFTERKRKEGWKKKKLDTNYGTTLGVIH